MARFLFVVPPLAGHTNPTVSVGRELVSRGHRVAWVAHRELVRPLLPDDAELIPVGDEVPDDLVERMTAASRGLRGAAALKFLWADFIVPLARSMVPGVDAAVDRFRPEVLVVDQQAIAGALVARRRGLAWATSATTSAEFTGPLEGMPLVDRWVRGLLADLQLELGLSEREAARGDLRFSAHLVIGFTTEALVGPLGAFPEHYVFVGPSIHDRPESVEFPWEELEDRPRVLVSLGTVNSDVGDRFYRTTVEALGSREMQVILVAPPERVGVAPDNVLVRSFVPQLALMEHMDAVVSHGGHNTVCESLAHGLPLVVAPIRDDQPIVAEQVVRAGAGLRVRFGRLRAEQLRSAVEQVLREPDYREAARGVQDSFASAGGASTAADHLEGLC